MLKPRNSLGFSFYCLNSFRKTVIKEPTRECLMMPAVSSCELFGRLVIEGDSNGNCGSKRQPWNKQVHCRLFSLYSTISFRIWLDEYQEELYINAGLSHHVVLRLAPLLFQKVSTVCFKSSFLNRNIREQRHSTSIMLFRNMKQKFYHIIAFSFTCRIFPYTLTIHCVYIKCVYWNIDMPAFKHKLAKLGFEQNVFEGYTKYN